MNNTSHELARALLDASRLGITYADLSYSLGGELSRTNLDACAATFRSQELLAEFDAFTGRRA